MKNTLEDLLRSKPKEIKAGVQAPADVTLQQIGNEYTKIRVVTAVAQGTSLQQWIEANNEWVRSLYKKDRILLFRGFEVNGKPEFAEIVKITSDSKALEYSEPSTPRTKLDDAIYTSTEYPKEQKIPQHNEHSYSDFWPKKLFFYCEQPSETGGQTPVCSSAAVLKQIPASIVERFEARGGIMYVRNFSDEMDISWEQFFGTGDKAAVEAYCKERKMTFKWLDDNRLRISQVAQATIIDKISGEKIWFNQAHLFHYSNLNEDVVNYLVETYGKENLPRNTFYGDGSDIAVEDLDAVRHAYDKVMFKFDWQKGDLLLMDNVGYTHGRESYTGKRSLFVSMSEEDGIKNYAPVKQESNTPENIVSSSRQNTARHFFTKESRYGNSKQMLKYKLALACRMLRMLDLDEGSISGHISVKVPGSENLFWVNPFGVLFDEVTPDNLILVDENGNVVEGDHPINVAGFCIHSSIHQANKDIHCIVHTHSPWGTLFSALEDCRILPIDQNSCMFYENHIVYKDFDGPVNNLDSAAKLTSALQDNSVAILANHGSITCGDDIETAIMYTICLERAMRLNVKARELNAKISLVDSDVARESKDWIANPLGFKIEFDALARRVEREYPDLGEYYPESINI
ncbi:class II aldolase/adducin family protein [Chitinophaga rhizophila]|uniref:Class II aldolase/adducin family protein n=1 Tax=Chitinophaga rhizophila TaxID=2866212 RepID=A0ABS7G5V6_9BACT|nr:class II aldolase/adducin family protein [Chitinophaga rhizophila]MBW8683033.1 class II aldolase/adducin family protein [Chitinophaga rhizophila]